MLSPILFIFCIDWLMKRTTENNNRGIPWTFYETLDLYFADDIALMSQRYQDIQGKTEELASFGKQIGLNINTSKTKVMKINTTTNRAIKLNNSEIQETDEFVYLGSKITIDGEDSTSDVHKRISKARSAFASLHYIWKSTSISTNTKIRIFKSNILGVLLYGAESWKETKHITNKLDTFQTRCLRRILKIFWPNTISNEELHERTATRPISSLIKERRWKWIGHVHRMEPSEIPKIAMRWTPPGKRR